MNIFSYVKSKISILDVIGEYVTLKPAGSYWKGYSPFKNEKTASFTVSPHKEIYYCFSSCQGGDVIDFVAKMENCSPLEAARHLIERYNLTPPETIHGIASQEKQTEKETYERVCKFFANWCNQMLKQSKIAQDYLQTRSLTHGSINLFNLGYCPTGSQSVKNLLTAGYKENILAQDLLNAQLLMEGKWGLYCPFEERILFPINDHLGRTCGFGGRVFTQQDSRAKYYNSHEHAFFSKSTILYGLDQAKKNIQKEGSVFLVEGYLDCIAMTQAGYPNTIATLGTACTLDHLSLLARYAKKIFVIYDGDSAGKKAIVRLAQMCWQVNIDLFVITLPPEDDPASYLEKHTSLEPLVAGAQDIFIFFVDQLGSRFLNKSTQEKISITAQLLETIGAISDPLKQNMLLQRAATSFDIPLQVLTNQLAHNNYKNQPKPLSPKPEKPGPENADFSLLSLSSLEKNLFSAILTSGISFNEEDEAFLLAHLPHPLTALFEKYKKNKYTFDLFLASLTEQERQLSTRIMLEFQHNCSLQTCEELFIEFLKKQWKMMVNDVKIKLAQTGTTDSQALEKILTDFQNLKKSMLRRGIA